MSVAGEVETRAHLDLAVLQNRVERVHDEGSERLGQLLRVEAHRGEIVGDVEHEAHALRHAVDGRDEPLQHSSTSPAVESATPGRDRVEDAHAQLEPVDLGDDVTRLSPTGRAAGLDVPGRRPPRRRGMPASGLRMPCATVDASSPTAARRPPSTSSACAADDLQ